MRGMLSISTKMARTSRLSTCLLAVGVSDQWARASGVVAGLQYVWRRETIGTYRTLPVHKLKRWTTGEWRACPLVGEGFLYSAFLLRLANGLRSPLAHSVRGACKHD